MFRVNFELRFDSGRLVKSWDSVASCGLSDADYDRLLLVHCSPFGSDVELHLINITIGASSVVGVFPNSLSPTIEIVD